jgi:predicted acetyltransferase
VNAIDERPRLLRVAGDDWTVVGSLFELFTHDLSDFRGTLPGRDGRFHRERWRDYIDSADRLGYLVLAGESPIGFVLVRGLLTFDHVLASFFLVRAVRSRGIGAAIVAEVLARHPGRWQVAFQEQNPGAVRFWRRVMSGNLVDVAEERRDVPGKPDVAPDLWISGWTRR